VRLGPPSAAFVSLVRPFAMSFYGIALGN
jgi:hypothetical protein